jgi:hypothetical protein
MQIDIKQDTKMLLLPNSSFGKLSSQKQGLKFGKIIFQMEVKDFEEYSHYINIFRNL